MSPEGTIVPGELTFTFLPMNYENGHSDSVGIVMTIGPRNPNENRILHFIVIYKL